MQMITARQLLCRQNAVVVNAIKQSALLIDMPASLTREEFESSPPSTSSTVVVYCANWHCSASERFGNELRSRHFEYVLEFKGGILEWALCASLYDTFRFTDHHHTPVEMHSVYQRLLASAEGRYP